MILLLVLCGIAEAGHGDRPEKRGILLAAFGTTVPEARNAYSNLERMVKEAFPRVPVRWAYTSRMVREKMGESGRRPDSVETALARMMDEGFTRVAVQSLHTIGGWEFHDLARNVRAFAGMADGFKSINLGGPLLNGAGDIDRTARALLRHLPPERRLEDAVVFMGHGTDHPAGALYTALMVELGKLDSRVLLGTVEGRPGIEDVRVRLRETGIKEAYLIPFMAVAGDHARNDLAGDAPDSWRSILERDGVQCTPVLMGTAEMDSVAEIWLRHLKEAVETNR